jgi:hypothetical protein
MKITLEDIYPLLAAFAEVQKCGLEHHGDTLLLRLPTQKYKNFSGDAVLEMVVRLDQGKILLRCMHFCRLEGPYWPQLFAACLGVQIVPDSAVQFVLVPDYMGPCLGTCLELPLEDNEPSKRQLASCVLDLHVRTDSAYEPLMEVLRTGQFTRVKKSLPPIFGELLDLFRARD